MGQNSPNEDTIDDEETEASADTITIGGVDIDIPWDSIIETRAIADKHRFALLHRTMDLDTDNYPVPHDQLAREAPIEGNSLHAALGRLLEAGLLMRTERPSGTTGVHYAVTDRGIDLMDNLAPDHRTPNGDTEDSCETAES